MCTRIVFNFAVQENREAGRLLHLCAVHVFRTISRVVLFFENFFRKYAVHRTLPFVFNIAVNG